MSSQHLHLSAWQLLICAIAVILCGSGLHSVSGQDRDTSYLYRAPSPPAYTKRFAGSRPINRAKQPPGKLPQPSPDTRADEK